MSSINGLNAANIREIARGYTRTLADRAGQRGSLNESSAAGANSSVTPANTPVNQRSLTRATRDFDVTLRGVNREAEGALEAIGSGSGRDQVAALRTGFEDAMKARYESFVESGAQDYMSFASETAVARRQFQSQLREITAAATRPTQREATTLTSAGPSENTTGADATGAARPDTTGNTQLGVDRAQRDIEALVRGLDREFERLGSAFGGNAEAMERFTNLRDSFIDSAKTEFESLAGGSTGSYMEFVSRVASMRQRLGTDLRAAERGFAAAPAGPRATPMGAADATEKLDAESLTLAPQTPTQPQGPVANDRNITRAKRDADLLLSGMDTEAKRYMDAMGDTPASQELAARAQEFRSMLEERLKGFIEGGGTNYMEFAEEMAAARRSLSGSFASLAGPKIDRLG